MADISQAAPAPVSVSAPTPIGEDLFQQLFVQAAQAPRRRMNYDLRTQAAPGEDPDLRDSSQRMLNALLPGTMVPVHRHLESSETVVVIYGRAEELFFDETGECVQRIPMGGDSEVKGVQIPRGIWHTIRPVGGPAVVFESKDGAFRTRGEGAEMPFAQLPELPL